MRQDWSPEQIAGRLKLDKQPTVSHECIYLYVYADKRRGGTLHRHLRSQKKQRKRYSGYIRRGQIPNRTSIDKRPQIVASKGRFGDWEADTIVGARHKGGILSVVERKSKLTRLRKLATKGAAEMKDNSIELLAPLAAKVHASTSFSLPASTSFLLSAGTAACSDLHPLGQAVGSFTILLFSFGSTRGVRL